MSDEPQVQTQPMVGWTDEPRFKVGQMVKWRSCGTTKQGTIAAVIHPERQPDRNQFPDMFSDKEMRKPRFDGFSYVVKLYEPNAKHWKKPKHYWPFTKDIELINAFSSVLEKPKTKEKTEGEGVDAPAVDRIVDDLVKQLEHLKPDSETKQSTPVVNYPVNKDAVVSSHTTIPSPTADISDTITNIGVGLKDTIVRLILKELSDDGVLAERDRKMVRFVLRMALGVAVTVGGYQVPDEHVEVVYGAWRKAEKKAKE